MSTSDTFTDAAVTHLAEVDYDKSRDWFDGFVDCIAWARSYLAAQETYGERAPCGCDLTGPVPPAVHIVDRHEEER